MHDPKAQIRAAIAQRDERKQQRDANIQLALDFVDEVILLAFAEIVELFGPNRASISRKTNEVQLHVKDEAGSGEFSYRMQTVARADGAYLTVRCFIMPGDTFEEFDGTGNGENIDHLIKE